MLARLVSAPSATGRCGEAEPLGPQPHLRGRLLAGEVDGAAAGVGERGRHLEQQRRLADAGLAADQQRRAGHDAAAGDAVEFRQCRWRCAAPPPRHPKASPAAPACPWPIASAHCRARPRAPRRRLPRRWCSTRRTTRISPPSGRNSAARLADEVRLCCLGHQLSVPVCGPGSAAWDSPILCGVAAGACGPHMMPLDRRHRTVARAFPMLYSLDHVQLKRMHIRR